MAAPGAVGVVTALFMYVLTCNMCNRDPGLLIKKVSYDNTKPPSTYKLTRAQKHVGFGKYALAATFIYPQLFSRASMHTKTTLKPQQSLSFIIAICLLLSGDIHQCPGPLNSSTNHPIATPEDNRSMIDNLQVHTLCTFYTATQKTYLDCSSIPPASAAATTTAGNGGAAWDESCALIPVSREPTGFQCASPRLLWMARGNKKSFACPITPAEVGATLRQLPRQSFTGFTVAQTPRASGCDVIRTRLTQGQITYYVRIGAPGGV
ncbi:hypothetical protein WMY93_023466 [Mugilogobius chulae]|uniref:Uncharacterized protein n=1 Tax=Mugilogobius chulae TaxID=88201 RepID=A0AAW0NEV2_9GOBI